MKKSRCYRITWAFIAVSVTSVTLVPGGWSAQRSQAATTAPITSLSQFGITWTFAGPVSSSQFADGNGHVDIVDIQHRAVDASCLPDLAPIARLWRQAWPGAGLQPSRTQQLR